MRGLLIGVSRAYRKAQPHQEHIYTIRRYALLIFFICCYIYMFGIEIWISSSCTKISIQLYLYLHRSILDRIDISS